LTAVPPILDVAATTMRNGGLRTGLGAMARLTPLAVAAILLGACSAHPPPSDHPMSVRLVTELAACNSVGGCAGYVSLSPKGGPTGAETRLSILGPRHVTSGLPPSVAPGSYTVRFRSVRISDEIIDGRPASEVTAAECSIDIETPSGPSLASGVDILVVFGAASCEATATYGVATA
jgi:hypothetical protein